MCPRNFENFKLFFKNFSFFVLFSQFLVIFLIKSWTYFGLSLAYTLILFSSIRPRPPPLAAEMCESIFPHSHCSSFIGRSSVLSFNCSIALVSLVFTTYCISEIVWRKIKKGLPFARVSLIEKVWRRKSLTFGVRK